MRKFYLKHVRALTFALATLLATVLPEGALAQVVTQLPTAVTPNVMKDLGNGPLEIRVLQGSVQIFTSQFQATGTAPGTTALTLTGTPATPPIIGGFITCNVPTACSIPANTTVTAYNGTTLITLSAAATITAAAVNYGAACPAAPAGGTAVLLQGPGGADSDLPLYTQARLCAWQQFGPGATLLPFAIGAH